MSIDNVYEFVHDGNNDENSNCIIYSDLWKYSSRCRLVKKDENVHDVVNMIRSWGIPGLFVVDKIIDYKKDVDEQLSRNGVQIKSTVNSDVMMMENVRNAIRFATYMHRKQDRKDGTPYIKHPLNVLMNVKTFKKSKYLDLLLMSAVLHDTIEDTDATYFDIAKEFGYDVATLVMELTTDEDLKDIMGKEKYLEIKMQHMTSWALVIKLCDRLDNVSDLVNCDNQFRNKYVNETIGILDYLFTYGKFTKTHLNIIEVILCELAKSSFEEKERLLKINELMEKCINLRKEFGTFTDSESDDRHENVLRLQRIILKHIL